MGLDKPTMPVYRTASRSCRSNEDVENFWTEPNEDRVPDMLMAWIEEARNPPLALGKVNSAGDSESVIANAIFSILLSSGVV